MSAINKLIIRNFQSHAHTKIELGGAGTLNVLVGESDAGKTALGIRALRWLFYNQPDGDDFRRTGCDFVEVEAHTSDGHTIVRRRTASTNRYIVDGAVFEGFGRSVPVEVQAVTGVRPVRLGDQEILANLAGQLDAPFLGNSISGPARAKALGKLAGIEVVDRATRELSGDAHRTRTERGRLADEAEKLAGEITKYGHLPALAERIERLRLIARRVREAEERLNALRAHHRTLVSIATMRNEAAQTLERWEGLPGAEAALARYTDISARKSRLSSCYAKSAHIRTSSEQSKQILWQLHGIESATGAVARGTQILERSRRLRSIRVRLHNENRERERAFELLTEANRASYLDPVCQTVSASWDRTHRLRLIRTKLENIRQQRQAAIGAGELASQTLSQAMERYESTLLEAGKCPTCGASANHAHLKEVVGQ